MTPADEMRDRIMRRLMEHPEQLDELRERLEDDQIIEHGTFETNEERNNPDAN